MGQDATKCLMGSTGSSSKQGSEVFASDPATYKAGLAVRRNSSNLLSVVKADGRWVGISLGRSLSNHTKTTVLQAGEQVPVLLEADPARGHVTITSYANLVATSGDTLKLGATTFTAQSSAVSHGGATFRAATSNAATATSLADQINFHAVAGPLFLAIVDPNDSSSVIITAKNNATLGASVDLVYTDTHSEIGLTVDDITLTGGGIDPDYVVKGAAVYFSDSTGKADDPESGATISNAIYVSEPLTGVDEDGNEVYAALVDMVGGL